MTDLIWVVDLHHCCGYLGLWGEHLALSNHVLIQKAVYFAKTRGDLSMNEFEEYLALYEIDPVRLPIEAHIRYLTVYNAKKGNPILPENAQKIKDAVLRLTGVPFIGPFVLMEFDDELNKFPFHPSRIKRVSGDHHHP
jgi:hypothetical protein